MLPLTSLFASANQNEKKHSLTLLEKTRQILFKSGSKLRSVITDSQYSDGKIRMAADEAVNSLLKTRYSMALNKVRGLKSVASYALYSILCLVLNREAAQNIGRVGKAVPPTYFNT
jgi:hypothetical protein